MFVKGKDGKTLDSAESQLITRKNISQKQEKDP